MVIEHEAVHARDPVERLLESGIVERVDLSALPAHEMMVMLATGMRGLEARDALTEVDPMDEAQVGELLEHPVHACDADSATVSSKPVEELLCREATVLRGQKADHGVAGTTGTRAGPTKLLSRMPFPGGLACLGHKRE